MLAKFANRSRRANVCDGNEILSARKLGRCYVKAGMKRKRKRTKRSRNRGEVGQAS